MEILIAQIINGLVIGGLYSLVVVGLNLLLLVRGVVHFAYAHIVVISMYVSWMVLNNTGNIGLSIVAGIISAVLVTIATEPIFRPLALRKAFLETVVVALGLGMILTEIMAHFLNRGRTITFPTEITSIGDSVHFGMISISPSYIYALMGSVVAVICLYYLLYHSKQGRAFRAVAQDLNTARLLGIPLNRTGIYSFAVAGLLAGLIGVFLAMTLGAASPSLGDSLAVKAMTLMLFAGLGNLKGGLFCALLFGLAESLTMTYLPGRWTEAIVFGVIMIAIIMRPQGIFGSNE